MQRHNIKPPIPIDFKDIKSYIDKGQSLRISFRNLSEHELAKETLLCITSDKIYTNSVVLSGTVKLSSIWKELSINEPSTHVQTIKERTDIDFIDVELNKNSLESFKLKATQKYSDLKLCTAYSGSTQKLAGYLIPIVLLDNGLITVAEVFECLVTLLTLPVVAYIKLVDSSYRETALHQDFLVDSISTYKVSQNEDYSTVYQSMSVFNITLPTLKSADMYYDSYGNLLEIDYPVSDIVVVDFKDLKTEGSQYLRLNTPSKVIKYVIVQSVRESSELFLNIVHALLNTTVRVILDLTSSDTSEVLYGQYDTIVITQEQLLSNNNVINYYLRAVYFGEITNVYLTKNSSAVSEQLAYEDYIMLTATEVSFDTQFILGIKTGLEEPLKSAEILEVYYPEDEAKQLEHLRQEYLKYIEEVGF